MNMDNLDKDIIKVENNFSDEEKIYELYDFFDSLQFEDRDRQEALKKDIRLSFSSFQKPIKYKNLSLYPITMQYFEFAQILFSCLTLRKNTSGDINAISMSYFDYLFYLAEKGTPQYVEFLYQLLLIVLKKEKYAKYNGKVIVNKYDGSKLENIKFFSRDGKHYNIAILKNEIEMENFSKNNENYYNFDDYDIFNSSDFDNIRKLICEQNDIDIPNENLRKEVIEEIEKAKQFQYEKNKDKFGNLEDRINSLIVVGGIRRKEIMSMSIRNFNNCIERLDIYINYYLTTILSPDMSKEDREKVRRECSSWLMGIKKISDYERYTRKFDDFNNMLKPQK